MNQAIAWVLSFSNQRRAALGEFELIHILPNKPKFFAVPHTPVHCRYTIFWQDKILPIIDIGAWVSGDHVDTSTNIDDDHFIAIAACRTKDQGDITYSALLLSQVPVKFRVDAQPCGSLPDDLSPWGPIAVSCFEHPDYGAIPVIDLATLMSVSAGGGNSTAVH